MRKLVNAQPLPTYSDACRADERDNAGFPFIATGVTSDPTFVS